MDFAARMGGITVKDTRTFEIAFRQPFGLVRETLADAIQPSFVLRAQDAEADGAHDAGDVVRVGEAIEEDAATPRRQELDAQDRADARLASATLTADPADG